VECRGPGDLAGVQALIDGGELVPAEIVAVMGKTEGNGCVNDYTRELASQAWCHLLSPLLGCSPAAVHDRVALVMSGGTEGVLSPHFTVFARRQVDAAAARPGKRLVLGIAHTRAFLPHEIGRAAQIEATAHAVRTAMADAGIDNHDDVHFVQVKCPLLTSAKIAAAIGAGTPPVTRDTYESMGWSRGASALGVAVALGEMQRLGLVELPCIEASHLTEAQRRELDSLAQLGGEVEARLAEQEAARLRRQVGEQAHAAVFH
jgi:cyanuric acid amidohydrolase